MLNVQLARKYSTALFEIAVEEDKLVAYGEELKGAVDALKGVPHAIDFLANPQVETQTKKDLITKCFKSELMPNVFNFLLLLVDKRRIALLEAIEEDFHRLSNEKRGIVVADVTTAKKADAAQQKAIREKLATVTGKTVELRLHEDESIIGGVVVKIGDRRIDGSVAGRLEALKRELLSN